MGWSEIWDKTKKVSCDVGKGVAKGAKYCADKVDEFEETVIGEQIDHKFKRMIEAGKLSEEQKEEKARLKVEKKRDRADKKLKKAEEKLSKALEVYIENNPC